MTIALILCCISFALFLAYNIALIAKFGIPESLSNSFYLYNSIKPGLGYIFTGFMFAMAITLLPAWLEVGEVISSWSTYLQPLVFFAGAAICFVGAAPWFRAKFSMEPKIHTISAMVAAGASLLWCFVVCWQIMYVPLIAMLFPVIVASCTKTWKSGLTYWLEMMAFDATFATVLTECILHV